jgi:hypothetical protein
MLLLGMSMYCACFQEIKLEEADVVLTAGTESMSQAPYAVRNARWGTTLGVDLKVSKGTVCQVGLPWVWLARGQRVRWGTTLGMVSKGTACQVGDYPGYG